MTATGTAVLEAEVEFGSEVPRVFTPPLRDLVPDVYDDAGRLIQARTTDGYSVIAFAEGILKLRLLPWQKWLLIHMLELLPNGRYRFRYVVILVARQNGKSTVSQVLALWWLYVGGRIGVLGVAQDLGTAEEIWEDAVDLAESVPELQAEVLKVWRRNGKKELVLKKSLEQPTRRGPAYKVKAANRRAGRGLTADGILMDELREQQSWDAWASITKTTTARRNAQIVALSNAGDFTSVVLRKLRLSGHRTAGDPDGLAAAADRLVSGVAFDPDAEEGAAADPLEPEVEDSQVGLFEWSGPPGCAVDDRRAIAQANPSIGYDMDGDGIEWSVILGAAALDDEWVFRPEHLCQWQEGVAESAFAGSSWTDSRSVESCIVGPVWACIDMSASRQWTYVAFAGAAGIRLDDGTVVPRPEGGIHIELVARRGGDEWVFDWLAARAERIREVTGQWNGAPISGTIRRLAAAAELPRKLRNGSPNPAHFPIPVVPWEGPDLSGWFGLLHDGIRDGNVWHVPQPVLDVPAALGKTRRAGDGKVWDRTGSPVDIAAIVAATGAAGLFSRPRPVRRESAYASRGVVTV